MRKLLIKFGPLALVFGFALFAALPLFQSGFIPTHDGEYHLVRFFEFEKMLKSGYLFPRWAPGLNSGYGVPLFNFHYPLPNYLGVFYHMLGFTLADSFKLTLATGYVLAVVFCYLWLSKTHSKLATAASTIIFAFVPYWFVDIYVRGSVGEVLAIMWLMLAFAAIERDQRFFYIVSLAGIILSHNILTLLFLPLLIGYSMLRKPVFVWYVLGGIGLAAYFWLPAIVEQQYVRGLNTVNYQGYFAQVSDLLIPSWGTGFYGFGDLGNRMSVQIGIIPLFLLFLGVIFLLKEKNKAYKILVWFFVISAAISVFFMLDFSNVIWRLIPILLLIQYPWRFLSLLLPITAFLAAYIIGKMKKACIAGGIAFLAVVFTYSYSRPAVYAPRDDNYYLIRINFTDGTSSLGNAFSTRWSGWKSVRATEKAEITEGEGSIHVQTIRPLEYTFDANLTTQGSIRVNTLYYPGWTVSMDGQGQAINYGKDGTITFTAPQGQHQIRVFFTETPLRLAADIISILSLFWLVGWAILKKWK